MNYIKILFAILFFIEGIYIFIDALVDFDIVWLIMGFLLIISGIYLVSIRI